MLSSPQRAVVFWGVCVPLRAVLAWREHSGWQRAALRTFAAVIGSRWVHSMEVGREGLLGGHAWWAGQRVYHGALWSLYALSGAAVFLKTDVLFGGLNWVTSGSSLGV